MNTAIRLRSAPKWSLERFKISLKPIWPNRRTLIALITMNIHNSSLVMNSGAHISTIQTENAPVPYKMLSKCSSPQYTDSKQPKANTDHHNGSLLKFQYFCNINGGCKRHINSMWLTLTNIFNILSMVACYLGRYMVKMLSHFTTILIPAQNNEVI